MFGEILLEKIKDKKMSIKRLERSARNTYCVKVDFKEPTMQPERLIFRQTNHFALMRLVFMIKQKSSNFWM
jgi:hypothetical protein